MTVDTQDQSYTWKNDRRPYQIREVFIRLQNDGETKLTEIMPFIKIETAENETLLDLGENFRNKEETLEILPGKFLAFPLFDALAKGPWQMEIQFSDGLESVLDKKLKLTAFSQYHIPNDSRVFKTLTVTFEWAWCQPDILREVIKLKIYGQSTARASRKRKVS